MATNTYVALQSQTLTTAAASVTFSSISQAYTDLVLVISSLNNTASNTSFQFQVGNGTIDTTSKYSFTGLYGTGSAAASERTSNDTAGYINGQGIGTSTTIPNVYIQHFMNYSNTTTYKTILGRGGSANLNLYATVNLWRSTSAIDTIKIFQSANSMAAGSTFTLYGIAAEGAGSIKATGGLIYTDTSYVYHVFNQSGTFTPSSSLSADTLVVAGGGGGGAGNGGGGGAGGLRVLASQSFASGTGYSCTVGSGGAGHGSGSNGRGSAGNTSSLIGGSLSISASGGGAGGGGNSEAPTSGGSGGGGGTATATNGAAGNAGSYSPVEGYAGGNAVAAGIYSAGGGGGAGGVGTNATSSTTAAGGIGATSTLIDAIGTATNFGVLSSGHYYFAGGGGGGADSGTVASGGLGGGGNGGIGSSPIAVAGTPNTGGGGGGQGFSSAGAGGAGGSGLIIVRYAK